MRHALASGSVAAVAVLMSASGALAFVPWVAAGDRVGPNGTASFFTWANGGSETGLYGSPRLIGGDTFVFLPTLFRAEAANGTSSTVSDRLDVELYALPGFRFSGVQISEFGDYGIRGGGSVNVTGSLTITDLNNTSRTAGATLTTNPNMPINAVQQEGDWNGGAGVDLASQPPTWTAIRFSLQNDLLAVSVAGSTVYVQKNILGGAVAVTIIPAPAGLAVLGMGGLLAARRRRA